MRYSHGNPPSIQQNWTTSTTGNKQIGPSSHAQWIPAGLPGAGQFLVYNNAGDLFETTPQSYVFQINGYLNASTNDTGAYVNPSSAGYYNWTAPGHDTDKRTKSISRQITWMYYSMANQGMFSHLDLSVQRLEQTMDRLKAEFARAGKSEEYEKLKVFLGAGKGIISYVEVAKEMGMSEGTFRVAVHRLRRRFREIFQEEVAQTVSRPEEIEDEVRYLISVLGEGLTEPGKV